MSDMWRGTSKRLLDTPTQAPTGDNVCRRFVIPNDPEWLALVNGVFTLLMTPELYRKPENGLDVDYVTSYFAEMFLEFTGYEFMIGAVLAMVTDSLPSNMVWCEGQTLNRVDYPELYGRLHSNFIIDADTFTVPDLRSRFIFGVDAPTYEDYPMGQTGGLNAVTLTMSEIPSHSHIYEYPSFNLDLETAGAPDIFGLGSPGMDYPTSTEGGGNAHENMPPFMALRFAMIARARGEC